MFVVIAGASGFLGTTLTETLTAQGHDVVTLRRCRDPKVAEDWNPYRGLIDHDLITRADAVINLSGSPIQQWPRTAKRRIEILRSRVESTATLANAVAMGGSDAVFLSASGMSWYGTDRGDEILEETAGPGSGFLAEVTHAWESAAEPAVAAGARVAFLRTSLVLDPAGGALKLMLPLFRAGLGGRLGSGKQFFSTISLRDWVGAAIHLLENPVSGPVNMASPNPVTNREFTRELGRALKRPTVMAAPAPALRLALGGMADDLLGSLRLDPRALRESGYTFQDPTLSSTFGDLRPFFDLFRAVSLQKLSR